MGNTQTLPDYPKGITFEQVWAALMENREQLRENAQTQKEDARQIKETQMENARQIKENQMETARQIKENQMETARQIKETQMETDKQIKEINKRFGDYSNRLGEITEYMIAPNLRSKFRELGFVFPQACSNRDVSDYDNDIFLEIDVMLENGDKAMLVEVKTKLTTEDIKEHIERLEKMRKYADLHGDRRTFLGAVAGVVIPSNIRNFALKQGLFVVEPSGETFFITPPYGKPKEW
jgi:chemotaxis protein histidine kinase CheA